MVMLKFSDVVNNMLMFYVDQVVPSLVIINDLQSVLSVVL